jgi:hypothetical protein
VQVVLEWTYSVAFSLSLSLSLQCCAASCCPCVTCAALLCCDEVHQPGPHADRCPHAPSTH